MFSFKLISLLKNSARCFNCTAQKCYASSALPSVLNSNATHIKEMSNGVEIVVPHGGNEKPIYLDYMWLFNHCRCSKCFNWKSLQKFGDPRRFAEDIKPLQVNALDQELHLTWSDNHRSTFTFDFLQKYANNNFEIKPEIKRRLWNDKLKSDDYPHVFHNMSANDDTFAREVLNHLLTTGFCFITNVQPTFNDTREVIQKIAPIQKSYLGEMWDLVVVEDFSDTAYTNEALPPHVDGTYLTDPFGLIMLHCINEAATGGDSFLIDGFNVVNQLKDKHPEHYEYLSKTPIESTYVDKQGLYYKKTDTIIKHDPITNDLEQLRFNFTDISPISNISQYEIRKFYKAYGTLSKLVYDSSNRIEFHLKPGTMLLFDNWRLVHGRTPFTGNRMLCGCFIGRSDFLSRSRVLGLLSRDFEVKYEQSSQ